MYRWRYVFPTSPVRETDGACRRWDHNNLPVLLNTMNSITTWNPFREMEDMQERILRAMNRASVRPSGDGRQPVASAAWAPSVDISEDANEYLIKAELPEVTKEEVKVTVENGVLTVSGERKLEREEADRKYHRIERSYGSFLRSFALPEDADPDRVTAEFRDGLLQIRLPKSEVAKPKQIEVSVT